MADYFWSRIKGKFIDKTTGAESGFGAYFGGTIREWYETLIETMCDVSNQALRENGGEDLTNVSWRVDPDVGCIIECSVLFKPLLPKLGVISSDRNPPKIETVGILDYLHRLPVHSRESLDRTGRIELVQHEGSPSERIIGSIQVLDIVIKA